MIRHQVTGVAKLTSPEKSDVDAGGGAARATIGQQQDGDISRKSYRYVRTAMVGLLVCLAAAVVYQSWRQGDPTWLKLVSTGSAVDGVEGTAG